MLANDAFRTQLRNIMSSLRAWSAANRDVASSDETEVPDYWRFRLAPFAAAACPVELIIHDRQRYDIAVGPESYEDRAIESMDLFVPLVTAVTEGRVVTRTWTASATAALHSVETLILLPGGLWTAERINVPIASCIPRTACIADDRIWAPYRLPDLPSRG